MFVLLMDDYDRDSIPNPLNFVLMYTNIMYDIAKICIMLFQRE